MSNLSNVFQHSKQRSVAESMVIPKLSCSCAKEGAAWHVAAMSDMTAAVTAVLELMEQLTATPDCLSLQSRIASFYFQALLMATPAYFFDASVSFCSISYSKRISLAETYLDIL